MLASRKKVKSMSENNKSIHWAENTKYLYCYWATATALRLLVT